MHYYAKLNENQICTEVITRARELPKDLDGFIKIPDYNETYLWRQWLGKDKGWSQERYEPSIEAELQDRVERLETENTNLKTKITNLQTTITELNMTNEILIQSITELTAMIAMLQAPTE